MCSPLLHSGRRRVPIRIIGHLHLANRNVPRSDTKGSMKASQLEWWQPLVANGRHALPDHERNRQGRTTMHTFDRYPLCAVPITALCSPRRSPPRACVAGNASPA